jgi:hypothetical protein
MSAIPLTVVALPSDHVLNGPCTIRQSSLECIQTIKSDFALNSSLIVVGDQNDPSIVKRENFSAELSRLVDE